MKINKERLYIIAFTLFCFISLVGGSILFKLPDPLKIILYLIIIACLGLKILLDKYKFKILIIYFCIAVICIYTYFKTGAIFFLINFLIIIASKDIKIKKIVLIDFIIKFLFISTHFLLYGIEYVFNYNSIESLIVSNDGFRVRNALFFVHPNIAAGLVLWSIIDYFYLSNKIKIKNVIYTSLIMFVTYVITGSRTSLLVFILFILLFYFNKIIKDKRYKKILNCFQRFSVELVTVVSLLLAYLYQFKISIIYFINNLTSGRVYYSFKAITDFGINVFGNANAIGIDNIYPVDNFYIRCAILYGMVFVFMLFILEKLIDRNENKFILEKILFIVLVISMFSEYYVFIIGNSIVLLLVGKIVIDKKNEETRYIKTKKEGKHAYRR